MIFVYYASIRQFAGAYAEKSVIWMGLQTYLKTCPYKTLRDGYGTSPGLRGIGIYKP